MKPATSNIDTIAYLKNDQRLSGSGEVIEMLAAAVYTCDMNGYITYFNKAAAELWGREPELGKDLWCGSWKIYYPHDGSPMVLDACPMAQALKTGIKVRGQEIIVERPDGVRRNILPHPDPIFDSSGTQIGAVNMLLDITDLKQKQEELRRSEENLRVLTRELEKRVVERTEELSAANRRLLNQNRELEQFAFIASHDIQEPVRKIKAFASRVNRNVEAGSIEAAQSYISKILNAASHLETLIQSVLTYSRFGYQNSDFMPTDLNKVIDEVLEDLELNAESKKAVIMCETLPTLPAVPLQLKLLFNNLIRNSLKFCKEDVPCAISIKSRALTGEEKSRFDLAPDRQYYDITVKDNGIGFRQEFSENIFRLFKRLHSKEKYEGSGIGLALCKKIVDAHEGHCFATSEVDRGTEMHIIIPASL